MATARTDVTYTGRQIAVAWVTWYPRWLPVWPRQHGEDPTWRPRPPWMWPAFITFFVCLALFILICIVDEIAYAVSRRLGKRTRT
ncbi:hypothetical protein GCM10009745_17310 [Kribbella yunnanensis]|uniref:Uncharacterized protein n=1 Tax=Kribbella yunnanensis TaxID=190194 RepID=A0ABN2GPM1_9ACTN